MTNESEVRSSAAEFKVAKAESTRIGKLPHSLANAQALKAAQANEARALGSFNSKYNSYSLGMLSKGQTPKDISVFR